MTNELLGNPQTSDLETDAGMACRQVGYLSASQFSREYGRFFGNAPMKDIARLREGGMAGPAAEA
jgi:hypothetical protein